LKRPVVDNWWMTETGWPIASNFAHKAAFPIKSGSCGKRVPGFQLTVLSDEGEEVKPGMNGNLVIKLPLPPGSLLGLWRSEERFFKSYFETFPGYFQTGDAGFVDNDGYTYVMSRTDDIMNVAGHRLSTGTLEEVIASHKDIAECAVFGVADELKGQVPLCTMVLKDNSTTSTDAIEKEVIEKVRERLGPVYSFKKCITVKRLPKTRSGKILRGTMRKIADGEAYKMPATIDDPTVLEEIHAVLKHHGYPKKQQQE